MYNCVKNFYLVLKIIYFKDTQKGLLLLGKNRPSNKAQNTLWSNPKQGVDRTPKKSEKTQDLEQGKRVFKIADLRHTNQQDNKPHTKGIKMQGRG